jgi:hypothetical protein
MENLEKLIPILFIIFWVIISLQGKKKKRRLPPPVPGGDRPARRDDDSAKKRREQQRNEPAPGLELLQNLRKSFENLSRELAAGEEGPSRTPADAKLAQSRERREKLRKAKMLKAQRASQQEEVALKDIMSPAVSKPGPLPAARSRSASRTARKGVRKYSVRKLRDAVVWSEILAPPVSMRDE